MINWRRIGFGRRPDRPDPHPATPPPVNTPSAPDDRRAIDLAIGRDWPALFGADIHPQSSPWDVNAAACRDHLDRFVASGDRARDTGRTTEAARAYLAAATLAPWRFDIRLQLGNMQKDSGRIPAAEATYRAVIAEAPTIAEAHLQLGHALKLVGRRSDAIASYRMALRHDDACAPAHRELFLAGEVDAQGLTARHRRMAHDFEQTVHMAAALSDMRATLAALADKLPDIAGLAAYPIADYAVFRRFHDIPPPPVLPPRTSLGIVVPQEGVTHAVVAAQVAAVAIMRHPVEILTVGASAAHRACWDVLDGGQGRVRHHARAEDVPADLAFSYVLALGRGRIPHPHLLDWAIAALTQGGRDIVYFDEEVLRPRHGGPMPFEPRQLLARPSADPLWLAQRDTAGATIAMRGPLWSVLGILPPEARVREAMARGNSVGHVPYPLVGTTDVPPAEVEPAPALPAPFVPSALPEPCTIILCTRDNASACKTMVDSLRARARSPDRLDIIIVDNGSTEPAQLKVLEHLDQGAQTRVLRDDRAFNWSGLNNDAAAHATTPHLLFCNDDMEMLTDGWDIVLDAILREKTTGAVGARLLYADDTMQHAGVLLGWQGSVIHDGLYEPRDSRSHFGRWQVTRGCSAVTGAFLGVRRDVFATSGGFDSARMPVAYSDIDLCLRLKSQGLRNVWTPLIEVRHDESVSRGLDHLNPVRHASAMTERAAFEQTWGRATLASDPSVNPVWADATLPWRLLRPVPAHVAMAWVSARGTTT